MPSIYLLVAADFIKTGGMDRANYALADAIARSGDELHLVAHSVGEGLLRYPNLRWRRVRKPLGFDFLGWGPIDRAGRRAAAVIAARGGHVLVNGGNCRWGDGNWVHYVHAAYASPLVGGPAVRAWQAWKHRRALRDEAAALRLARVVIANSEASRRLLISQLGLAPERVHTVYYGCDPVLFAPLDAPQRTAARARYFGSAPGRVALFIGALGDRRKGFDTLFDAWRRLAARPTWDVRLMVLGSGRERAAWEARTHAAGLQETIQFLGFRRDVPELLRGADLLVAPTRYEAFGLAVQEAVACGLPAIVSASAGAAERVAPELGELLSQDPDSSSELEQLLLTWRAQTERFNAAALQVSQRLRAHTWDHMAADILRLLDAPQPAVSRRA